jgi:hypothetical protein
VTMQPFSESNSNSLGTAVVTGAKPGVVAGSGVLASASDDVG